MDPYDQHFLVIGPIENSNLPAFGKPANCAPKKIVFQLLGARLFEAGNLAALRIDPRHNMPDGAIINSSVHPLKN